MISFDWSTSGYFVAVSQVNGNDTDGFKVRTALYNTTPTLIDEVDYTINSFSSGNEQEDWRIGVIGTTAPSGHINIGESRWYHSLYHDDDRILEIINSIRT